MRNTTHELLFEAEEVAMDEPAAEPTPLDVHLNEVEEREELLDALAHTVVVSPEVAAECREEMRRAEQRGWRETE